ncbi:MAG: hypothetical protein ACQESR_01150, partial [Planctomycetota bacterium]
EGSSCASHIAACTDHRMTHAIAKVACFMVFFSKSIIPVADDFSRRESNQREDQTRGVRTSNKTLTERGAAGIPTDLDSNPERELERIQPIRRPASRPGTAFIKRDRRIGSPRLNWLNPQIRVMQLGRLCNSA